MKIKVGDRVRIDKEKIYVINYLGQKVTFNPIWYSKDIFTIINIIDEDTVTLNKNLPNCTGNKINIHYLTILKTDRKKKLLELKNISIMGENPI